MIANAHALQKRASIGVLTAGSGGVLSDDVFTPREWGSHSQNASSIINFMHHALKRGQEVVNIRGEVFGGKMPILIGAVGSYGTNTTIMYNGQSVHVQYGFSQGIRNGRSVNIYQGHRQQLNVPSRDGREYTRLYFGGCEDIIIGIDQSSPVYYDLHNYIYGD